VPMDFNHVNDKSVKIIHVLAFQFRQLLVSVETHDELEKIERWAFNCCTSLRGIKLPGVREIKKYAFHFCSALTDVEFGDKLDTIGVMAFCGCESLQNIKMPSVRNIGDSAFRDCKQLIDVELPHVDTIGTFAFIDCHRLRRIAIPLKDNLFLENCRQRYTQFDNCANLTTVDLAGAEGIHETDLLFPPGELER